MMINSNTTCIIADDLTGANDTALQFYLKGANCQILLEDTSDEPLNFKGTQVWAISTETRNLDADEAIHKVADSTRRFIEMIKPDYFFKKIDSTLRGNIAVEVLTVLETIGMDAAIMVPAFPQEGRVTIGGYHLLKGIPIERTEMARDPHSPIFESHIPTLMAYQLGEERADLVGSVELKTVMKGAGPIVKRLKELIEAGRKIIVMDAVSTVDIEQIILAMSKLEYNILPVGAAALAHELCEYWYADSELQHINKTIPSLPKLVVSGSATNITAKQIEKLEQCDEYDDNTLFVKLDLKTIVAGVQDELVNRIVQNLGTNNIVVVHTSNLLQDFDGFSEDSLNAELTKSGLANVITDFLSELTKRVLENKEAILITLGGETSYKCCRAIGASQLQLIDEVAPAIALCLDHEAHWIVTKSGNLGGINMLVDILNYFENHE